MKPAVFIGSSTEGLAIAQHLQPPLEDGGFCEVTLWSQGVFKPSTYTLPSIAEQASASDFAILIATPDDAMVRRDEQSFAPRDNVILELGIFIGALGLERVFLVADNNTRTQRLALPSDLAGLTWIAYNRRDEGNLDAASGPVALRIRSRMAEIGPREACSREVSTIGVDPDEQLLAKEIARISDNARAQGWKVRTTDTTLRLEPPGRQRFSFSYAATPRQSRTQLRDFAATVRANGLRVNRSVRQPIE